MIYQLENEKKKMKQRDSDDFSGYLSEEALLELIGQVESEEMLRAPVHLKENILTQIGKERRASRKRQIFAYRAKVLIAMAAALTVLILMPAGSVEDERQPFLSKQPAAVSMEQAAVERQKNIDDKWEEYREEQASGGVRGMLGDIGARVSQFGRRLSWDRDME
ncbi:MAG: hypothetical protein K2P66_04600 [Lachnospiraceae bacterium]|nr:hypothetical protein [Lachnospiraceae bacterium]